MAALLHANLPATPGKGRASIFKELLLLGDASSRAEMSAVSMRSCSDIAATPSFPRQPRTGVAGCQAELKQVRGADSNRALISCIVTMRARPKGGGQTMDGLGLAPALVDHPWSSSKSTDPERRLRIEASANDNEVLKHLCKSVGTTKPTGRCRPAT